MGDKPVRRVEVSVGDVHSSNLVIGDHATIQTPEGTEVTVLQVGDQPEPRLRPRPVSRRPQAADILGREDELELIASADAATPTQLYAGDGAGKTSLLKFAAERAPSSAEGVVFVPVRSRSLDEINSSLYAAFWECDDPFIPAPAQMGDFLGDREALLFLDDCGLDRDEVEMLLDGLPRCAVVIASEERTLWSRGSARALGELDPTAAIGLLERELGRTFDPQERAAAEAVVARLGGKPQALVEAGALVEDGRASLRELADDPAALERRFDPSALTDSQKRILEILTALDGAALGTDHVSAIADLPDPQQPLRELERRGWVKSASPRYRIVRRPASEAGDSSGEKIAGPLLGQLTAWSRKAGPGALAAEAEAIEGALELGTSVERWEETLALSLAAERGLTVAGAWCSCRRVLQIGLGAASVLEDQSARAYVLHQLGSQALCLGETGEAEAQLGEALQIRKELGEHEGADLTRHNLNQLWGGGEGPPGNNGGDGGPWRPWGAAALVALVVVAGVLTALALGGGSGENAANTSPSTDHPTTTHPTTTTTGPTTPDTTTVPPSGTAPTVSIESPSDGATFQEGRTPPASFRCIPAEDAEIDSCEATIDGDRIDSGTSLESSPGEHTLRVTAVDDEGRTTTKEVSYRIASSTPPPPPPPTDETPPVISVSSPTAFEYEQGAPLVAEYSCSDTESEPVTCSSEVENGAGLDTKTPGLHSFTITATDSAGNESFETVEYEVTQSG